MQARRAVLDWAQDHVDDRAVLSDIALAVTEATTNVVLHAYRDREVPGTVIVEADGTTITSASMSVTRAPALPRGSTAPAWASASGLIAQVADSADVRAPETGGTEVVMRFNVARAVAS